MSDYPICELCGEPMPKGEGMFRYHGHSGPCPICPPHPNARYLAEMKLLAMSPNARYTCESCGKEIISGADSQNVACHSCGHMNKSTPKLVQ